MSDIPMMGSGMMTLLGLIGLWLYSIFLVLPCWIIAYRTKEGGKWWNWVLPLWNLYTAFKLGRGPIRPAVVILILIAIASVSFQFKESPYVFAFLVVVLFLSVLLSIYVFYVWLRNVSILANINPYFLPMVMLVVPFLLGSFVVILVLQQVITPVQASFFENVVSIATWVIFFIVAIRTPKREAREAEFTFGKE